MSDRDNFAGGFVAGAVLGGLLGGIVGASLSRRQASAARRALRTSIGKMQAANRELNSRSNGNGRSHSSDRRWMDSPVETQPVAPEARIEEARRNLEHKIAQLNIAIDDARQQLSDTAAETAPTVENTTPASADPALN